MQRERIEYLDTLKGIAIFLVVFCHYVLLQNESFWGNVLMSAAWGAVPCFFLVTGGLMHHSQKLDWHKYFVRLVKIYFVLCIWKLIYLLFFSTISEVTFSKIEFIKYLFLFCEIPNVSTGLMWFMYAYLAVLVFSPISYFLFSGGREGKKILKFVTVALFCGSVLVSVINFVLKEFAEIVGCGILEVNSLIKVLPFGGYMNMLFYFILGAFLFSARNETKKWMKQKKYRKWIPLMLVGLGILGLLVIKFCDMGSFRWNAKYLQNGYNRLSTCILALGMYGAVQQQEGSKIGHFFAKYIGKETMGIFYLHFPVLALYWKYWNEAFKPYYSLGLNLVKTCIVIVICIVITRILKKIPIIRQLVM